MAITCPKCGYERGPGDRAPAAECPRCGVLYVKAAVAAAAAKAGAEDRPAAAVTRQENAHREGPVKAVITDIKIPFGTLFVLCFQFSLAAVPAAIAAGLLVYGILMFTGLGGAWLGKLLFH